jgi:hypothetical protein
MSDIEIKILNDYLIEVVKNSYKCQHCMMCHSDNTCFFAYDCIKKDFYYWREED